MLILCSFLTIYLIIYYSLVASLKSGIREYRNTEFREYENTGIREYKTLLLLLRPATAPACKTFVSFSCLLVFLYSISCLLILIIFLSNFFIILRPKADPLTSYLLPLTSYILPLTSYILHQQFNMVADGISRLTL